MLLKHPGIHHHSMGHSKDKLNWKAKLPRLKKLIQAHMATGKWHDAKITCQDERSMVGFPPIILLPDIAAINKGKGTLSHIFDAEEVLYEVNKKHIKLSTVFTPVMTTSFIEDIVIPFANLKGFFTIWFDCNLYVSATRAPALIRYTNDLADKLNSKEAKDRLSNTRTPQLSLSPNWYITP